MILGSLKRRRGPGRRRPPAGPRLVVLAATAALALVFSGCSDEPGNASKGGAAPGIAPLATPDAGEATPAGAEAGGTGASEPVPAGPPIDPEMTWSLQLLFDEGNADQEVLADGLFLGFKAAALREGEDFTMAELALPETLEPPVVADALRTALTGGEAPTHLVVTTSPRALAALSDAGWAGPAVYALAPGAKPPAAMPNVTGAAATTSNQRFIAGKEAALYVARIIRGAAPADLPPVVLGEE